MNRAYAAAVIIALCGLGYYWVSQVESIATQEMTPAPINLLKQKLAEREYWLKDNIQVAPSPPKLIAEDVGIMQPFCIVLDFTISSEGKVVAWEITKVYPESVAKELSEDDFSDIQDWQFKVAPNNTEHLPVIARRIFGYNKVDTEKCFN